ncbi:GNAT family N-acetyltransferase [Thermodesulfovibrio sp. TK110]
MTIKETAIYTVIISFAGLLNGLKIFLDKEALEIKEVINKKQLKDFVTLPLKLYKNDSFYASPLIKDMMEHLSEKNPFFKRAKVKFYIAYKGEKPVGRIAALVNYAHLEYHQDNAGFFGVFECVNDQTVANALFDKAKEFLKENNLSIMRGPMNLSTNEECGFLYEGFDTPSMIMIPYNPPYYNKLAEAYGMKKAKDLYCFLADIPDKLPSKIERIAHFAEKQGIRARTVKLKNLTEELYAFMEVYNEAWASNWGFIPITKEEIDYMAMKLKPVALPELVIVAEKDGKPVGFFGAIPDFNEVLRRIKGKLTPLTIIKALYYRRKIQSIRLLLFGVKKEMRHKGVESIMLREAFKGAKKYGFKKVEFSWILEDNYDTINLTQIINARRYKILRIYETNIMI